MKNQSMVMGYLATALVVGTLGFYGGTMYQKSKVMSQFGNRANGRTGMMQGQPTENGKQQKGNLPSMMGRGAVVGEISSKDDKSITVKMNDGSSRNIILSESTTYRVGSEAKKEDLATGTKVAIFGTPNSDGSTTASSIEINPLSLNK